MKSPKSALSLIEVLVAFLLLILICGALYRIISSARHTSSVTIAKGEAKEMVEIVLRAMERDISTSYALITPIEGNRFDVKKSFSKVGEGWTMLVPVSVPNSRETNLRRVTYLFNQPSKVLERDDASATKRLLCEHVDFLEINEISTSTVAIEIKVGIVPPGSSIPQVHHQKTLVNIRQAREANLDPRWRNPNDFDENKY